MSPLRVTDLGVPAINHTPMRSLGPSLPRHLIRRDRLNCLLSLATQTSSAVVIGSPGAGKSVLVADWCREQAGGEVSWVRLNAGDNHPETFWTRLLAVLHAAGGLDTSFRNSAASIPPSTQWILRSLGELPPHVIVLDNFHHITHPGIIGEVASLIRDLPPHVRLVLIGRQIHGAALKSLLLRDGVTALTDTDLRFTMQEVASLIPLVSGRYLPIEEIETLALRCEGWAAGLHLAATALGDDDDPASYVGGFSGASASIADYFEHEVLLCHPPELSTFLLQTSVLEDLTPELCGAVTGRNDAGEMLAWLAGNNLFVVPVEGPGKRYRYHRLLAEFLRSRSERTSGSLAGEAHGKAGAWFEQAGDLQPAARHFALAGRYDRALRLTFPPDSVVPVGGEHESGKATDLLNSAPGHFNQDPARLYMVAAAMLTAERTNERTNEALSLLRNLEALTADTGDAARWRGRIEFLCAVQSDYVADPTGSLDHCRAADELMQSPGPALSAGLDAIDATISEQLPLVAARAHASLGEPSKAESILAGRFGSRDRAEAAEPSMFAVAAWRKGLLTETQRFANEALRRQPDQRHIWNRSALEAHLALADVLYERDELVGAEQHLQYALGLCQSTGSAQWRLSVNIDLIRVMVAQQRPREALSRLWQLRHGEQDEPASSALRQRLNEVEIACRIFLGDLDGVLLLARSTPPADFRPETLALIDLFTGRPDRVLSRLRLARPTSLATDLRRELLLACADAQRGDILRAEDGVRRAVDRGRPEGYVRPFLEQARFTLPILRSILGTAGDPYLAHLVHEAEHLVPDPSASSLSNLIEPLTERERELLTYLATHYHLREIASRVYLSHNTVKTHTKAIYRKLGAASRAEAVAIARARGIL